MPVYWFAQRLVIMLKLGNKKGHGKVMECEKLAIGHGISLEVIVCLFDDSDIKKSSICLQGLYFLTISAKNV